MVQSASLCDTSSLMSCGAAAWSVNPFVNALWRKRESEGIPVDDDRLRPTCRTLMRLAPDSGRNAFPQENRGKDVLLALSCEDARLLTLLYGNSVEDYQLPSRDTECLHTG